MPYNPYFSCNCIAIYTFADKYAKQCECVITADIEATVKVYTVRITDNEMIEQINLLNRGGQKFSETMRQSLTLYLASSDTAKKIAIAKKMPEKKETEEEEE